MLLGILKDRGLPIVDDLFSAPKHQRNRTRNQKLHPRGQHHAGPSPGSGHHHKKLSATQTQHTEAQRGSPAGTIRTAQTSWTKHSTRSLHSTIENTNDTRQQKQKQTQRPTTTDSRLSQRTSQSTTTTMPHMPGSKAHTPDDSATYPQQEPTAATSTIRRISTLSVGGQTNGFQTTGRTTHSRASHRLCQVNPCAPTQHSIPESFSRGHRPTEHLHATGRFGFTTDRGTGQSRTTSSHNTTGNRGCTKHGNLEHLHTTPCSRSGTCSPTESTRQSERHAYHVPEPHDHQQSQKDHCRPQNTPHSSNRRCKGRHTHDGPTISTLHLSERGSSSGSDTGAASTLRRAAGGSAHQNQGTNDPFPSRCRRSHKTEGSLHPDIQQRHDNGRPFFSKRHWTNRTAGSQTPTTNSHTSKHNYQLVSSPLHRRSRSTSTRH